MYCARITSELISPQSACSFTVLEQNELLCTGFRNKLVCMFLLSSSSWIWFQSKQFLFSLNSVLFCVSSLVTVMTHGQPPVLFLNQIPACCFKVHLIGPIPFSIAHLTLRHMISLANSNSNHGLIFLKVCLCT